MKPLFLCILTLTLAAAAYSGQSQLVYERDQFSAYTPQNFDKGGAISHYQWRNFNAFYPHATIYRTQQIRPLPGDLRQDVASFEFQISKDTTTLARYVANNPYVDAMLVLHKGKIVFEAYPRMRAYERHLTWSVSKVIVGTALAVLQASGLAEMQAPVEQYLPELSGTAWAGIRIQDIANMASGIDCLDNGDYYNDKACVYRYEETLGITARVNPEISTLALLRSMKRRGEPNIEYEYVSVNTFVLGMVIERITDKPLWQALQELIWDKIGAESDALLAVDSKGQAYASGGLSMRLRDVARFGQIFTDGADLGVLPRSYLKQWVSGDTVPFPATDVELFDIQFNGDKPSHAAWQWDMIWADGDMYKSGFSGQGIYVSPSRELVMVYFGTHGEDGTEHSLLEIVRQLSTSGLFP